MWPLLELFRDGTAKSSAVVHDFLRPLVDEALKLKADRSATPGDVKVQGDLTSAREDTFLEHLVESTDGPCLLPAVHCARRFGAQVKLHAKVSSCVS